MSHLTYPNESAEYRRARTALLEDEIALRLHSEPLLCTTALYRHGPPPASPDR
jgi:predicted dithiol-disulfide oxidoreductase (DUF899 family)